MTTLCIISNDDKNTYFLVPTKEIPKKLKGYNGTHHYADYGSQSDRALLHKYFGIALDNDMIDESDLDNQEKKIKYSVPIFENYKMESQFMFDPNWPTFTVMLESST